MPERGYRPVATQEGGAQQQPARATSRLQWVLLFLLTAVASVVLYQRVQTTNMSTLLPPATSALSQTNGTQAPRRRKRKGLGFAMGMGRMGTSSSFVLRSRRRSIKNQVAKAATRSVILVGSHFGLGTELLTKVFGELCQRARLSLRCESPLGGSVHDLKSLAAIKGKRKRRIVWLERDAGALRRTLRGLRAHAANFRLVHLLWDPMQACAAQWPATIAPHGPNVTMDSLCSGLHMEKLSALYKRAKRHRTRSLQLRLEDIIGRQKQSWRQLSKFLELPDKEVASVGTRAVSELGLRGRVLNSAAPAWVHESLAKNTTLSASLRKLRQDLEYSVEDDDEGSSGGGLGQRSMRSLAED